MNRELTVPEAFGGRLLAGGDGEHLGKQSIRRRVERFRIVHDPADVDVDVVGHLPRRARVAL